MINKFEAIGIFVSVAGMATALFLLRVENTPNRLHEATTKQTAAIVVAQNTKDTQHALSDALQESVDINGVVQKIVIDDIVIGHGTAVKEGDTVTVNYIGTLQNGQQFDNSYKKGTPLTFTVGEGRVIAGLEQGILGMQTEGKRVLVIPSDLAYGTKGIGPIPANATLIFSIELLKVN